MGRSFDNIKIQTSKFGEQDENRSPQIPHHLYTLLQLTTLGPDPSPDPFKPNLTLLLLKETFYNSNPRSRPFTRPFNP